MLARNIVLNLHAVLLTSLMRVSTRCYRNPRATSKAEKLQKFDENICNYMTPGLLPNTKLHVLHQNGATIF